MSIKPPVIWLFTDQKPGHLNQLRGLAQRLQVHVQAECHFIDVSQRRLGLLDLWRGVNLRPELPVPDLLVAAGSSTQRALLASRRFFSKPAVLLMRPNFPYAWLDAAIVPEHDNPPSRENILVTRGVLNAVQPTLNRPRDATGLMLVGGPSAHYGWDEGSLVNQIKALCTDSKVNWVLSDSRRTPAHFLHQLVALNIENLSCCSHFDTSPSWLSEQLAISTSVWVTPDSVSMVYEAITSGAATGLLSLPDGRDGRINRGIQALIEEGRLVTFDARDKINSATHSSPLWEADRAAAWLVARYLKGFKP